MLIVLFVKRNMQYNTSSGFCQVKSLKVLYGNTMCKSLFFSKTHWSELFFDEEILVFKAFLFGNGKGERNEFTLSDISKYSNENQPIRTIIYPSWKKLLRGEPFILRLMRARRVLSSSHGPNSIKSSINRDRWIRCFGSCRPCSIFLIGLLVDEAGGDFLLWCKFGDFAEQGTFAIRKNRQNDRCGTERTVGDAMLADPTALVFL